MKRGIHSFLSYGAEMDEGVHKGLVLQRALAGLVIISRDVLFMRPRWASVLQCYLLTDKCAVCSWTEWG